MEKFLNREIRIFYKYLIKGIVLITIPFFLGNLILFKIKILYNKQLIIKRFKLEDNKNKLMLINKNLKIFQEMYSLNSNYNLEEYVMNLVDIKIEYLEKGFNKIKINKKNLYFPSIFEIRKNSLEEERIISLSFFNKISF